MTRKPSTSRIRTIWMALLATLIGSHVGFGAFSLIGTAAEHTNKIGRIQAGTYSIADAVSASLMTLMEGLLYGWLAFIFVLPTALLYGIPSHLVLLKTGLWRKWQYALTGALVGMPAILATLPRENLGSDLAGLLLLGSFTGALTALVFRLLMGGQPTSPADATWQGALKHKGTALNGQFLPVLKAAGLAVVFGGVAYLFAKFASSLNGLTFWPSMNSSHPLRGVISNASDLLGFWPAILMNMAGMALIMILGTMAIHYVHRKRGRRSYATYIAAGAILTLLISSSGHAITYLLIYGEILPVMIMQLPSTVFWTTLYGALVLWIFRWLIARGDNAQPLPSSMTAPTQS